MLAIQTLPSERFRRLSKEGFWIVLGQAAAVIGALVGVRLITELLDPATYGELALGMTVATLVSQTALGPLGNGATRFYAPAVEQGDLGGYLNAVRRLVTSATALILVAILLTIAGLLVAGRTEWITVAITALIFAILSGYNSILNGIQNAARQRSIVALHQGIDSWARFLFAAGLMLLIGASSTVALLGYDLAMVAVLFSQCMFFRRITASTGSDNAIKPTAYRKWQARMWNYSWPFATWGIIGWARIASDRWAIQTYLTSEDVGLYFALFQLSYYPITILTGLVTQLTSPVSFARAGDASCADRMKSVFLLNTRLTLSALLLSVILSGLAFVFHTMIFALLVAPEYRDVSQLMPLMVLGGGMFAASQIASLNLYCALETKSLIWQKCLVLLLGVLLNFLGAAFYGLKGVVIAMLLFSFVHLVWVSALSVIKSRQI